MTPLEIILSILLVLAMTVVILLRRRIAKLRREQRSVAMLLASLEQDRPALAKLVRNVDDKETQQFLRDRTELVSKLLAAAVSESPAQSNAVLDEVEHLVAQRAEFMRQTRMIYESLQPLMIARLRESGLDDGEIEICCLYALGLNGKAIQAYTGDGRHYQNVGLIRKKLRLGEHDRNIDGYIRSLMR